MTASYLRLIEMPDAQPPVMLTPIATPQHLTTTQLREQLVGDRFDRQPHFVKEFGDLYEEALPHELTEADLQDQRAPTVTGKLLPLGAVTQLFPLTLDTDCIVPWPSPGTCRDEDALMQGVNSHAHADLLQQRSRPLPDYVAFASIEVEQPVFNNCQQLIGGRLVVTCPDTYYPTSHCRSNMEVEGMMYPCKRQRLAQELVQKAARAAKEVVSALKQLADALPAAQ
ncbi:hypothetical protein WJX84_003303 [Apatococcus fuscideae]|uniref:Uncharacterized protein n=1 Tax=Apatococcus fuscideae TaxID=2026836 RepID=A0AAW1T220_9CHLO